MTGFYDSLEKQYEDFVDSGTLEAFGLFEFDEDNSERRLIEAINYFRKTGIDSIDCDAPINHLNEKEKEALNKGGSIRPKLYAMLLFSKVEYGISNKELFLKHSYSYSKD